jgi:hypothetical protein
MLKFTPRYSHRDKFFEVSHLAEAIPLYLRNALQRGAGELGRSRHSTVDTPTWVYVLGIWRTPRTAVTQKSIFEHLEDPDRSHMIDMRV